MLGFAIVCFEGLWREAGKPWTGHKDSHSEFNLTTFWTVGGDKEKTYLQTPLCYPLTHTAQRHKDCLHSLYLVNYNERVVFSQHFYHLNEPHQAGH